MRQVEAIATGTVFNLAGRDSKYERWRWQIFAITWLAYAGFYLTRKSFAVAKIEMGRPSGLGLSSLQMSWIDGAFLITYALGQFFCGVCGDRYGTRKVVAIGMMGSVLAALAMGNASLVSWLIFFSALQGLFQSAGWSPLAKNMGAFFSQSERGTVMGLWLTNYAIGGFLGSLYAGYVGGLFGWRYSFWIPAGTLLIILLLFLRFQRNRPEDVGLPAIEVYHGETPRIVAEGRTLAPTTPQTSQVIIHVLKNPMVLLLAFVYFFMKPARYAIMFWAPKYLSEQLHTGMAQSGSLSGLFELAGPISVFLAGLASDKLFGSRRNPVCVVCLLGSGLLLFFFDKLPHTPLMLGGCLFLLGLFLFPPDSLISGTSAVDFGTRSGAATATGLINGCGSLGAVLGGTIPGIFHEKWGWNGIFVFLSVTLIISALLLLPKWNVLPKPAVAGRSP